MNDLELIDELGTSRRTRRQRRRRHRRRLVSVLAVFVSLAVLVSTVAGLYFGGRALLGGFFEEAADYPGPGTGEVVVTVPEGALIRAIGRLLTDAGVVASQEAFVEAASDNPDSLAIQPGDYTLRERMKASDALQSMLDAMTVVNRLTLREGLRETQIVARIAEESDFTVEQVESAVEAAELPAYAEGEPEGFLFPATYDIRADSTAQSLITAMVNRFRQAAETVGLQAGASSQGLSPRQVVTMASIIEREAGRARDMPRVARVIYNRLSGACSQHGIPAGRLQMDSTVHYAAKDYSSVFTSDEMRAIDSPYNTYRTDGLPPGPIASPGEAALRSALTPAKGAWCYFSAVNLETGETRFAQTAEEHQQNVAALQAWCRESGSELCG